MKRNFLLGMLALLLGVTTATACVKRDSLPQITGYVMDSTQALIPNAEVRVGKTRLQTSWDGRFILKSGEYKRSDKLVVSCEGYETQKVSMGNLGAVEPLIVVLKSNGKQQVHHEGLMSKRALGGTVMYSTMARADYATIETEAVMDASEVMTVGYAAPMSGKMEANNAVSAGKLTAGEVNDFAKWSLWAGILDGSHQQYVSDWKITPRHRYIVQVTNTHGYPLIARQVCLLDNSGNTLYQTVTDNTGKAELWYQLTGNNLCGKHAEFRIRVDDQVQTAKDWSEGINTFVFDEPCDYSDAADVLFVFDATGSMGDELQYLQAEMKDVIARAKEATGGLNIRTGALVYRDHSDEYLTRISRLTDDIATTQAFIDQQQAGGGGDYPEAVPEALMAALNGAGWDANARARIAFLILDAPCHKDSATIALLHDQLLNAAAQGVRIVPVVCSGVDESGELLMRSIALATNGTSFFLTDDSGIGNTHLKPTTDSLKVEHLNDMLVRTIVEFSTVPDCRGHWHVEEIEKIEEAFVPNPFEMNDLTEDERIQKDSPSILYLLDISGKLICIYEGRLEDASDSQLAQLSLPMLSTGVYFVKAFYDGKWHTKKILVH